MDDHASPVLFQPQRIPSLRDHVYASLRDAILSGKLAPGQRIVERELAAQLNMSTTPIKEALRRLEQDGLIVTRPRRGAVVSDLALTSTEEIVGIRANLEGLAARLAAVKMTPDEIATLQAQLARMGKLTEALDRDALYNANFEFHDLILQGSRNQVIVNFVLSLRPFAYTIGRLALAYADEVLRAYEEHRAICGALARRDGAAAETHMREHILRTVKFVIGHAQDEQKRQETLARQPAGDGSPA